MKGVDTWDKMSERPANSLVKNVFFLLLRIIFLLFLAADFLFFL